MRATFSAMDESTGDDWARIGAAFAEFSRKLPDRVLAHLRLLDGDGVPERLSGMLRCTRPVAVRGTAAKRGRTEASDRAPGGESG